MRHNAFTVSVPASSANLGPGFDAVGAALSLWLRARVTPARRFEIRFSGEHAPTHRGYERLFLAALSHYEPRLPRVAIAIDNAIPLGKGLGSSAAACVAGLAIAQRLDSETIDRDMLARDAAELEGHPDNACAAVRGGIVIAASGTSIGIAPPRDLRAVVVVPAIELATKASRAVLPRRYARDDVAFTAARASLLGAALATKSWSALGEAMRDRMHQPYRSRKVPGLDAIVALRMPGLLGVALSGAGPSVIAIVRERSARRIALSMQRCFASEGVDAAAHVLTFSARGLTVGKSA